ncbi:SAM-dependent methyltransferase [Nafulsella turpanensis]|uniref:SAM-dependent methyltransferase n=1 Tax=Nafulsella turpanensis TaxID=1265690 RepID=UPI0003474D4B|nr:class I SAM-dependent methyltransferase [Nafulsella turpanensis]
MEDKEWFGEWFDSPYYHILYKHRDYEEAEHFIDQLIAYFRPAADDKILDLACGKGRHSIYLNSRGLDVVGLDLSPQSIEHARRFANERLHFEVHDMRKVYKEQYFDYIFNLFTSFGYFETEAENQDAICAAAKALKSNGKLLIDFLNPYKVVHQLVPEEVKLIEGIEFHITKHLSKDNYIVKDIRFTDNGKAFHFQERVKAIRRERFLEYFRLAGLELVETFGDYELNPYEREQSDRMIFVLHNKPELATC